jgi:hypothetical protein
VRRPDGTSSTIDRAIATYRQDAATLHDSLERMADWMTRASRSLQGAAAHLATRDALQHGRDDAERSSEDAADRRAVLEESVAGRTLQYRRAAEEYSAIVLALDDAVAERALRAALPALDRAREDQARAAQDREVAPSFAVAPSSHSLGL